MNGALLEKTPGRPGCKAQQAKDPGPGWQPWEVGATQHLTCYTAQCLASRSSVQGHAWTLLHCSRRGPTSACSHSRSGGRKQGGRGRQWKDKHGFTSFDITHLGDLPTSAARQSRLCNADHTGPFLMWVLVGGQHWAGCAGCLLAAPMSGASPAPINQSGPLGLSPVISSARARSLP